MSKEDNGKRIPVEIITHLAYFYETSAFKLEFDNPFLSPYDFPALVLLDESG